MNEWRKYALIGAGVLVAAWWLKKRAAEAVQAINPTNDKNVFYQGASGVARALTGDEDGTLGTIVYDMLHDEGR